MNKKNLKNDQQNKKTKSKQINNEFKAINFFNFLFKIQGGKHICFNGSDRGVEIFLLIY
ncbi:hypothetical protein OENI_20025 [Oenococcus oeni]|nr:hypothetical protein OENI_30048 [Oenococcus oeni]SYW17955.1 hypothetical protein OENI_20025 [Oenococcus oeni]